MSGSIKTAATALAIILLSVTASFGSEEPYRNECHSIKKITASDLNLEYNHRNEAFEEGDEIEAVLTAPSGGKATLKAGNDPLFETDMYEYEKGKYKGTYKIKYGDRLKNGILKASYESLSGSAEASAPNPITVSAYFFKVRIISPENDSKTDLYFDIQGRTRPNVKVFIAPAASIGGMNPFASSSKSSLGSVPGAIETASDDKGYFKVHYGFPIKVPIVNMKFKFYVSAMDGDGKRSLPASFTVTMK